jgi:hypothetical protein
MAIQKSPNKSTPSACWALALILLATMGLSCTASKNAMGKAGTQARNECLNVCEDAFKPCRDSCGALHDPEECYEQCEATRSTCVSKCMKAEGKAF